jgi:Ca-activated chloride channel homolog
MQRLCVWLISAVMLVSALGLMPAMAQNRASDALLIFDASGSMWGQVGKDTKIIAARAAVSSVIDKWPTRSRLGLMAYGHRTAGDCRDIELIAPLGAMDKAALKAAAQRLTPRGKTPISASLIQAAGILKGNEGGATVILISDGIETCNADPCSVAAQLKRENVKLVTHVIGFDIVDRAAREQLSCIAKNTGGLYVDAKDAPGLTTALDTTLDAVEGKRVTYVAPRPPPPDPKTNVSGVLRLAEGADPLTSEPFDWIFYDKGGTRRAVGAKATMKTSVRPGEYDLGIWYGSFQVLKIPVTIPPTGEAKFDLVLNAGFVTSVGSVVGGGDVAKPDWQIRRDINRIVQGGWIARSSEPTPTFVLPAADYELRLVKGAANTKTLFSLKAGDSVNIDMNIDVGSASFTAALINGARPFTTYSTFEVREPDPSGMGNGKMLTRGISPNPTLEVPSGTYDLVVTHDDARRIFPLAVESAKSVKMDVGLDAGRVIWRNKSIRYVSFKPVLPNGVGRGGFVYNGQTTPSVVLNAGSYIAEVRFQNSPDNKVVMGEFPVTVVAGQDVTVDFAQP